MSAHAVMNRKRSKETFYTVYVDESGRIVRVNDYVIEGVRCSCPAYRRAGRCKHIWLCRKLRRVFVRRRDPRRALGWRLSLRRDCRRAYGK